MACILDMDMEKLVFLRSSSSNIYLLNSTSMMPQWRSLSLRPGFAREPKALPLKSKW